MSSQPTTTEKIGMMIIVSGLVMASVGFLIVIMPTIVQYVVWFISWFVDLWRSIGVGGHLILSGVGAVIIGGALSYLAAACRIFALRQDGGAHSEEEGKV